MLDELFDHYFVNNIRGNTVRLSRLRGEVLSGDAVRWWNSFAYTQDYSFTPTDLSLSNNCTTKMQHWYTSPVFDTNERKQFYAQDLDAIPWCKFKLQLLPACKLKFRFWILLTASTKTYKNVRFGLLIFLCAFALHLTIFF